MDKKSKKEILDVIGDKLRDEHVQYMKEFIQHGSITTYKHCINVVKLCYILNKKFNLNADMDVLMNGALLHDFYLYDWHDVGIEYGLHGFTHPKTAAKNAKQVFDIDDKTEGVIISHMWPLTLRSIPKHRESWLVTAADKYVSLMETLHILKGDLK